MAHSRATMNLFSLLTFEPTLFDDITLPPGIDNDIMKDAIFDRCAECALLWTEPTLVKSKINAWFKRKYTNIDKLYKTVIAEYNMLENVNMSDNEETINDNQMEGVKAVNETNDRDITRDRTDDEESEGTSEATTETTVSAFNSATYQPDNNVESSGSTTANKKSTENETTSENAVRNESESYNDSQDLKENRERKYWGLNNKDPQELLQKERDFSLFNVYETVAEWWEVDFCYGVY